MNPKQQRFVQEYILSGNATESYKTAYGVSSDEVAAVNASRLLRNANIKNAIGEHQKDMEQKTGITIEAVVKQINEIAGDKTTSTKDKLKALDMLMRHLGGYITIGEMIDKLTDEQIEQMTDKLLAKLKANEAD